MPSLGELGTLALAAAAVGLWGLWAGQGQAPVLSCVVEAAGLPGLKGRLVLVTGANAGIGYHVSLAVASRGGRLVMACRDANRGIAAREAIVKATGSDSVGLIGLDLSSMKRVAKFVENFRDKYGQVDVIINNAATGLGAGVRGREETGEGLERVMATNHLGPHLLTTGLLPLLADNGTVVTLSSDSNLLADDLEDLNSEGEYRAHSLYARSKLANILMTRELEAREAGNRRFHSVDPGFTWTDIHSFQLPALSSWLVWVAGPLLGARSPVQVPSLASRVTAP
jgi:NAD(P)-dependent dehydrogenase (short-subunit alcohol dehydrogenase family)